MIDTSRSWDVRADLPKTKLQGNPIETRTQALNSNNYALVFSETGNYLAEGDWDGNIRIWETSSGKQKSLSLGEPHWIVDLSFNQDGTQLISMSHDGVTKREEVKHELKLIGSSFKKITIPNFV